jgi:hypothetical protein
VRPVGGGGRVPGRHVLRPLRALEHRAGPQRLRVVVARGCPAGDQPPVRLRQRTRAALPPGRCRAGGGDAGRDVPRARLGGARQRRGAQRAHHRDPLAGQGGSRRSPARVRGGHPGPAGRRDRQPPGPGHRRPRQAVVAAGVAATAGRRGGQRRDRRAGRWLGRRTDHGEPAGRAAAAGRGRVPRRWRRGQTDEPPGAPRLFHRRGVRSRRRLRAVARRHARRLGGLGAGAAGAVRGGDQALHEVGHEQRRFIDVAGAEVLPRLVTDAAPAVPATGRPGR